MEVVSWRYHVTLHELTESLLVHLWFNRRELARRRSEEACFQEMLCFFVAVPKLQEVDD